MNENFDRHEVEDSGKCQQYFARQQGDLIS